MRTALLILAISLLPSASWACASCGCTLSPDFENTAEKGFKLDLRWDFINQNQLRSGTSTISSGDASRRSNDGNAQEVESYTKNNYFTAGLQYSFNPIWSVDVQIPYVVRNHSTLGTASDGTNASPGGGQYTSNTSSLGDVKLLGRFQGFNETHNMGVIFGLKLATGSHNLTGTSNDQSAPDPAPIDRALQPGSGTTDLILGFYYTEPLSKNWDIFTEELLQSALNSRDDYRPGNGYNANVGFRYLGWSAIVPQVQLNARYVERDGGLNGDTVSTGGSLVYLSPGLVIPVGTGREVYAFMQVPVYQNLLGVQLAPTYTASLGARFYF